MPSLLKYETKDSVADISITVEIVKEIPLVTTAKVINCTRFYDLFEEEDFLVQYQRKDKNEPYFGYIKYAQNYCKIYILEDELNVMQLNEYLLTQYVFPYYVMKLKTAIWMHGSSIKYNHSAYLFSAPSGTGKSTHAKLWKRYVDCEIINDDKNIIILENEKLVIYGNPWSGKHHRDNNISAPVKAIVFLSQAKENAIKSISPKEAIVKMLTQVIQPLANKGLDNWSKMLDELLKIPCFELQCNISQEAVKIAKDKLEVIKDET